MLNQHCRWIEHLASVLALKETSLACVWQKVPERLLACLAVAKSASVSVVNLDNLKLKESKDSIGYLVDIAMNVAVNSEAALPLRADESRGNSVSRKIEQLTVDRLWWTIFRRENQRWELAKENSKWKRLTELIELWMLVNGGSGEYPSDSGSTV